MVYAPVTSATAEGFMKKSLEIPRAKTTADMSSAVQMLEELVRKYGGHREKIYDNDLKVQRFHDSLPKSIEQQLVLEKRDGSATHESLKRRANNWIMINSTRQGDMNLETMVNGGDHKDNEEGEVVGVAGRLNGGKMSGRDTRQRTVSRQQQCATAVDSGGNGEVVP